MKVVAVLEKGEGKKIVPCDDKGSLVRALRDEYYENTKIMSWAEKLKKRSEMLATEQLLVRLGLDKYTGKRTINEDIMIIDVEIKLITTMKNIKQANIDTLTSAYADAALIDKTKKELDALGVRYKSVYSITDSQDSVVQNPNQAE